MRNNPKGGRLDLLLVERGLTESREKAQALILSGNVKVDGQIRTKSGSPIPSKAEIEIIARARYVGRGGLKLEHALDVFGISAEDKICLDIGASTGGFSDCLLQHGAKRVYAVDVGRGQLAWKLRVNPRIKVLEKINARYLSKKEIPEPIDLCTIDVSFISITKILPAAASLMKENGELIVLLKPQFEAGRKEVKKGIVKDPKVHEEVLERFLEWCAQNELTILDLAYSPITGADGNIEFLAHLKKGTGTVNNLEMGPVPISNVVREAHERLDQNS